jgi:hypothetical protein
MTVWVIFSALLLPLILSEFSEVSPWLARRLLTWGARRLGDQRNCERYREEWLAGLEDVPGKLTKLAKALNIVCYTVPVMHWRVKGAVYLWPARKVMDTCLAIVFPALCRRLRERRYNRYGIAIGRPGNSASSITLGLLLETLKEATKVQPGGLFSGDPSTCPEAGSL